MDPSFPYRQFKEQLLKQLAQEHAEYIHWKTRTHEKHLYELTLLRRHEKDIPALYLNTFAPEETRPQAAKDGFWIAGPRDAKRRFQDMAAHITRKEKAEKKSAQRPPRHTPHW